MPNVAPRTHTAHPCDLPAPFNDGFVLAGQFMPELLDLFDKHMETIVPGHFHPITSRLPLHKQKSRAN
jgi:hypothetical protein